MNRGKKQETKKAPEKREYDVLTTFEVIRAYEGRDVVFFSARVNGVSIYNMRICTNRNGEDFIAFPSSKGKNGQYYNECYFAFSPEDTELVIDAVAETLANCNK